MPTHRIWIVVAACSLWACGGSDTEPPTEAPTSEEPGAEATTTQETTSDDEAPPEAAPGDGAAITVTRLSGTESAPATGEPGAQASASVSVEGDAVVLTIEEFVTFCEPAPEFTARIEGGALVVQAERPADPTRCIGPHSARLRLEGVPAGERALSLRNSAGEVVATTRVSLGG